MFILFILIITTTPYPEPLEIRTATVSTQEFSSIDTCNDAARVFGQRLTPGYGAQSVAWCQAK
jgi:hypothetical protein